MEGSPFVYRRPGFAAPGKALVLLGSLLVGLFVQHASSTAALADGELISGNGFLQGDYVELGIAPNGAFGSQVAPPAGFHPRGGGGNLGFVADSGRDGWSTFDGDFFLPGGPFEGFALTINGSNYANTRLGSNDISGSLSNFVHTATQESVEWHGSAAGIRIDKLHTVAKSALWTDIDVRLTNTNSSATTIYYMRDVDPDNNQSINGSYVTTNTIVSQHGSGRAIVSATQPDGSYLALMSTHPDAKVAYGTNSSLVAQAMWEQTDSSLTYSGSNTADTWISLGFKFTLDPGQSVKFSYRYALALAPNVLLSSAAPINATSQAAYPVSGSCTTADGSVTVTVESLTATADCTANAFSTTFDTTSLPDSGTVSVRAAQTNSAGLTGFDVATVVKDTVVPDAPTVTNPPDASVTNTARPTISGTVEAGSTVTVKDGHKTLCTTTAGSDGTWIAPQQPILAMLIIRSVSPRPMLRVTQVARQVGALPSTPHLQCRLK